MSVNDYQLTEVHPAHPDTLMISSELLGQDTGTCYPHFLLRCRPPERARKVVKISIGLHHLRAERQLL